MAQLTTAKDAISATAKVSNPAPLGLAAFGLTTVVLSTKNSRFETSAAKAVLHSEQVNVAAVDSLRSP
jgi:succinate-acetate transporter protein